MEKREKVSFFIIEHMINQWENKLIKPKTDNLKKRSSTIKLKNIITINLTKFPLTPWQADLELQLQVTGPDTVPSDFLKKLNNMYNLFY